MSDQTPSQPDRPPNRPPARRETVLVVENEEINRRLMEQILGFAGYGVVTATNGMVALEILDSGERVDLVLLDLTMPVLDGIETTQLIRKRPQFAELPVVAVTAHALSEYREAALRSGCTDYLTKPFRPNDLLSLVARILGRMND